MFGAIKPMLCLLILATALALPAAYADDSDMAQEIQREQITDTILESLARGDELSTLFRSYDPQLIVDALLIWSASSDPLVADRINIVIEKASRLHWDPAELIRLKMLKQDLGDTTVIPEIIAYFQTPNLSLRAKTLLESWLCPECQTELPKAHVVRDLFNQNLSVDKYKSGRYAGKPRIFMFCRQDRRYHCLKLMKDGQGQVVQVGKAGPTWSQPSLAYSKKKLPFNQFNGSTPSGVWRIDGVMPEANKQLAFGKFRRLILNFVESSKGEQTMKSLLPKSSHNQEWWHEGVTARNMGRSAFRIHGTGLKNFSPSKPPHPFVPTRGCIAQRERNYGKTKYKDQRLFLDQLMTVSNLDPIFRNESRVRALLYVINIDNKKEAVRLKDLRDLGLKL